MKLRMACKRPKVDVVSRSSCLLAVSMARWDATRSANSEASLTCLTMWTASGEICSLALTYCVNRAAADRASPSMAPVEFRRGVNNALDFRLQVVGGLHEARDPRPLLALQQHFDRSVVELHPLHDGGQGTHAVDRFRRRVGVVILLCHEQNRAATASDILHGKGIDALLAANVQRHDRVRKHHEVTQRHNRIQVRTRSAAPLASFRQGYLSLCRC